jgi:hypothetical protein
MRSASCVKQARRAPRSGLRVRLAPCRPVLDAGEALEVLVLGPERCLKRPRRRQRALPFLANPKPMVARAFCRWATARPY